MDRFSVLEKNLYERCFELLTSNDCSECGTFGKPMTEKEADKIMHKKFMKKIKCVLTKIVNQNLDCSDEEIIEYCLDDDSFEFVSKDGDKYIECLFGLILIEKDSWEDFDFEIECRTSYADGEDAFEECKNAFDSLLKGVRYIKQITGVTSRSMFNFGYCEANSNASLLEELIEKFINSFEHDALENISNIIPVLKSFINFVNTFDPNVCIIKVLQGLESGMEALNACKNALEWKMRAKNYRFGDDVLGIAAFIKKGLNETIEARSKIEISMSALV